VAVAPRPLLLERERYARPVVVQTWLDGQPLRDPSTEARDWRALLEHLLAVHDLRSETTSHVLPEVVLTMRSAAEGVGRIRANLDWLPGPMQPTAA